MKSKKVHLNIENPGWQDACNKNTLHVRSQGGTLDTSKVTCQSCKKTKYYQEQVQKMESGRKASSEELGYEVLKYSHHRGSLAMLTPCPYDIGTSEISKKPANINSAHCSGCDYYISADSKKQQVKCSFKAKNKPKIHKSQTSLNESIEKEEVEKGIDEPFGETRQQSKYHKKYTSAKTGDSAELDVYDLLDTLDLPNAEIEHTFKKLIRNGSGDKSQLKDMKEAHVQLGMGIKRMENK